MSTGEQTHVTPASNTPTAAVAVARNQDGRLEAFSLKESGMIFHNRQNENAGGWSGWNYLCEGVSSTPAVAQNHDGRLELFAVDAESRLQHMWQNSAGSSSWSPLTGFDHDYTKAVAVASQPDGRLNVFALAVDGELWCRMHERDYSWGPWVNLSTSSYESVPAVGRNQNGRLQVFEVTADETGELRWNIQAEANGKWNDTWYVAAEEYLTGNPAVARNRDGRLEVFANAAKDKLVHIWQPTSNTTRMNVWRDFAGFAGAVVADAQEDGSLVAMVVTSVDDVEYGTKGVVLSRKQRKPGEDWLPWQNHDGQKLTQSIALIKNTDGRLELFGVNQNGVIVHIWQQYPNGPFGNWDSLY